MNKLPNIDRGFKVHTRLHYTWYVAFVLITVIVVNQFPVLYQLWERIALGLLTSLVFFLTIGIRQLIINFIARRIHFPLRNIILFVFGGASQLTREDNLPSLEVLMGVTGILLSLVLALIFYLIHMILVIIGSEMIAGLIQWLAFIILILTFFHIIPGFPLDGGRILLSILWKKTGHYYRAVQVTAWIGWIAGLFLMIGGIIVLAVNQQIFTGITLALVGLSLGLAATYGRREVSLRRNLQGISAQDIMHMDYPVIPRKLNAGHLVRDYILVKAFHYFVIADDGELHGIVTIKDIKSLPRKKWDSTSVGEIMTPVSKVRTARMNQSGDSLLEQMEKWGIEQIPVMEGDKLAGIVVKDDLIHLSQNRAELRKAKKGVL
jgi:Zn-dependent protease/predicted transcriptional regulator